MIVCLGRFSAVLDKLEAIRCYLFRIIEVCGKFSLFLINLVSECGILVEFGSFLADFVGDLWDSVAFV